MIPNAGGARWSRIALHLIGALAAVLAVASHGAEIELGKLASFRVVADGVPEPIGGAVGDADRGRKLVLAHESANCVVCHALPEPSIRFSGNLGPALGGVARKLSVAQLRLRVVDNMRVHPKTIMPSYYRIEGFELVAAVYRDKPILDAEQVEDIVAYLATLK
jgi:sulfur-oxidizing protein SoxX